MRVPSNIIKSNLYTSGGEFVNSITNIPYQGYYYEFNGKFYAGTEFNIKAPELIKKNQANQLRNNTATSVFSILSGITSQGINFTPARGINFGEGGVSHGLSETTFFCKQLNKTPILIKAIDEKTYLSLINSSIYQLIFIGTYRGLIISRDQAESQMIGLKEFLDYNY